MNIASPALLLVAALAFPLAGCDDSKTSDGHGSGDSPVRPPLILDEDTLQRLIATMTELRPMQEAQYAEKVAAKDPLAHRYVGVGISFHTQGADEVLKRHGFATREAFETTLAWTYKAINTISVNGVSGLQDERVKRLNDELHQLEQDVAAAKSDASLGSLQRSARVAELEQGIASIKDQLESLDSVSGSLQKDRAQVPAANIALVKAHRDELTKLLGP